MVKVTDRRSPLFIRHSGNFDLCLTIGERKKNAAYRILFLKEIRRPGDVWQLVGAAHESFQIFFFLFLFFCTNISNCWQPRSASAAFLHHYVQYCKTKQSRHKELHIYHETSHNANLWSGIWSWGVYLINMSN